MAFAEEHLAARVVDVLDLASEHVARLPEYSEAWGDEADPFVSLGDKVVVESAILALIATRWAAGRVEVRDSARALGCSLAPHARSERNRTLLMRYPHTALSLGIGHIALTRIGLPDAGFDDLLSSALASPQADSVERLPYRAMERRWLARLRSPGLEVAIADLVPQSLVSKPVHPIYMMATDVYALTHVPMFATDFGDEKPPAAIHVRQVSESLDAALAWCLFTENFDLLSELVLARELLDPSWSPYQVLAWHVLESAWNERNGLTCPSFEVRHFDELPPAQRSQYAFRHVYHTTYVAGMLFALLLRRNGRRTVQPVHRVEPDSDLVACCGDALSRVDRMRDSRQRPAQARDTPPPEGGAPGWGLDESALTAALALARQCAARDKDVALGALRITEHVDLPPDEVACVLVDGVLTCAARAYDLPMLAAALEVAAVTGLPLTATVQEATRFLLRQQLSSGLIGAWFVLPANAKSPQRLDVTIGLARALAAVMMRLEREIDHR